MPGSSPKTITQLLEAYRDGNDLAFEALFPLVYDELHALAHKKRQGWQGNATLNTTALVHEAYLKLADQSHLDVENRTHFFAVVAKIMRHILVDYARRQQAHKRGGNVKKISLEEEKGRLDKWLTMSDEQADKVVAVGEALKKLENVNTRWSQIVDCRFFCGMTTSETAEQMGISPATISRDWRLAQTWLFREIKQAS